MRKVRSDATEALAGLLRDDMTIVAGGFGLCGIPENLIDAIVASGVKGLTVVSNNCGVDGWGLGKLLDRRMIRKMISSYVGENKEFARQYLAGEVEVEFNPQGTWPSASAPAVPASPPSSPRPASARWSPRARSCASSTARPTSWSAASSATSRSSRPGRATARATSSTGRPRATSTRWWRRPARSCVAEVEHLVGRGEIDPDHIHTPGIFVDRIIQGQNYEKRIEQRTVRKRAA